MSRSVTDAVMAHEQTARRIQTFIWEGRPNKSPRKQHSEQEYHDFLESLRNTSWNNYDEAAVELRWRE